MRLRFISNLLLVTMLTGCATSGAPSKKISATSSELMAGEKIHDQVLADFEPLENPAVQNYVQTITLKLSKHAKRNLNYRVTVLKDERIYAISAPGGEIYITTSFLTFLKNEAELSAVLGHEIGQLQFLDPQFDPMRKTVNGVTKAGQMIGPIFGQFGALASLGLMALGAAYARDPNLNARLESSDRWAMKTMAEEKYDPEALLDVLKHFAKYDREGLSLFYDYYQSRPINVKRLRAAFASYAEIDLSGMDLKTGVEEYQKQTSPIRSAA